ncbi:MAG: class I SAM-dependent methyltransferase [Salibacteraceae bacterium]
MTLDYDQRVVRYEEISHYPPHLFQTLVQQADPQPGDCVLDLGAGYGAVTQAFLEAYPESDLRMHVLERSPVQLTRARSELIEAYGPAIDTRLKFYCGDFLDLSLEPEHYEIVVAKMVVHEFPSNRQIDLMKKVKALLAPGGRFFIWQTLLDLESVAFFRKLMRKKDELAGFANLARDRHFIAESELFALLQAAGFQRWQRIRVWDYPFDTAKRLRSEFRNEKPLLGEWNNYLAKALQADNGRLAEKLNARITNESVCLDFEQVIYEVHAE